jgi:hypothetical protein
MSITSSPLQEGQKVTNKNKYMSDANLSSAPLSKSFFITVACHEANKVWCMAHGDHSQQHWELAENWQKESAIKGVEFRIANPDAGESAQHDAWSADKVKDGWVYGPEKDATKKTHPCLVPFNELPEFQQKKDKLFCAIVDALK